MYNSSLFNNNDGNGEEQLSQEYPASSYHEMQPPSIVPIRQSTVDSTRYDPASFGVYNSRFDSQQPVNQPLSSIINSTRINDNNHTAPVTMTETQAKRRRTVVGTSVTPSTAPLPRKRFDPALQSTAASQMSNLAGGATTANSKAVASATKSITDTTLNGFNQTIKPLVKLCEETNQLIKEILKQTTDQVHLVNELVNFPRELQKTTQQLSNILHMQAMILQTRQHNDNEDLIMELNGVDLDHIPRGASLNATARGLIRAAYGENASFNSLAPGEFDMLLGFVARIHGLHPSSVFANSQSIKNSLQQMKHDGNKKSTLMKSSISLSKRRTSTTAEQLPTPYGDKYGDEDDEL